MSDRELLFSEFVNKTLRSFEGNNIHLVYAGGSQFKCTVDSLETVDLWKFLKTEMFQLIPTEYTNTPIKNFHRHIDWYGFGCNVSTVEKDHQTDVRLTFCV